MQAAMSLDTQRSCTVYLHTDGKQEQSGSCRRLAVINQGGGADRLALTGAAEALLANPEQHGVAVVAVRRLVEVLQTPHVLPVLLDVLGRRNKTYMTRDRLDSTNPNTP